MIKGLINSVFPHQFGTYQTTDENLFVADYTEMTKSLPIKRSLEFHYPNSPTDIPSFSLINPQRLPIGFIGFNNLSFVSTSGLPLSQCECVILPHVTNNNSWLVFIELKYSTLIKNNAKNLNKAIQQLILTHDYYWSKNIISITNPSYLFASIPPQSIPFAGFALTQSYLINLKISKNILLILRNDVIIENDETLSFV